VSCQLKRGIANESRLKRGDLRPTGGGQAYAGREVGQWARSLAELAQAIQDLDQKISRLPLGVTDGFRASAICDSVPGEKGNSCQPNLQAPLKPSTEGLSRPKARFLASRNLSMPSLLQSLSAQQFSESTSRYCEVG
jgi:hypothetical protein